jgi:release factor H-coupled RctB family protein
MSIRIIASKKNWITGLAVDQLHKSFELAGMKAAVGMPDLHPGKSAPIGAVFACERFIYPHLVGNDIGCGMGLWQTDLKKGKLKLDQWVSRLDGLDLPWDGDLEHVMQCEGLRESQFDRALGTIGGGNHFAELQILHKVFDEELFASLELDVQALFLLVHSGSRGLGESILRWHLARFGNRGLFEETMDADDYIYAHDNAVKWARTNRRIIAERFMKSTGTSGTQILDVCHNHVEKEELTGQSIWLHRKGAANSNKGILVIPGSRGTLSYLVQPTEDQRNNLFTVAHGAGRKWNRSECRARLHRRYSEDNLRRNQYGGRIICADKELLYEEAPQAYKDIDIVVSDLIDAGLVRPIATLSPVITYKTGMVLR